MLEEDHVDALARRWHAECGTAPERAVLALLCQDRRTLDAALATHTAAQLAAVRHPLPLYHAAALAGWPQGIAALAAAGVPPAAADALVQVEADSTLAGVLSKMTDALPKIMSSNSGSYDSYSEEGSVWAQGGHFSAVGLAAAMGHVEAMAALLAIGASATAGAAHSWCSLPAAQAAMVNEEKGVVPPGTTQALLSLLAAAGGQMSPTQVAEFVVSSRYMDRVAIPLLLQQLVAQRASLAGLGRDALQALTSAAIHWDYAAFFELLPIEFAADFLPAAAAREKPIVLLWLLRTLGRPLACSTGTRQLALSTALNAKQLASVAALLAAGVHPTAGHISQAIYSCQPDALRALLAAAQPAESSVQFGTIDVSSAEFASALPSFVHQALLVAAQDAQPTTAAAKWLQILESLQSAGYRLHPYRGVTVRLPGGFERRYERYDPTADDARISAATGMGHLRLAVSQPTWSPDLHGRFPPAFQRACRELLLAARRSCATQAGTAFSFSGLQPPPHLGSLPGDALLLIMQQAAYPLSLWAALDCMPPATQEAANAGSGVPREAGSTAALPSAPALTPSMAPIAQSAAHSMAGAAPAARAEPSASPPQPSSIAADVADSVAAFQAALGGSTPAGGSAATAAGPSAPRSAANEAPAAPTPEELSQGLAALSFSTHFGPFVFGGSG